MPNIKTIILPKIGQPPDYQREKMYRPELNYTEILTDLKAFLVFKRKIKRDSDIAELADVDQSTLSKVLAGDNSRASLGFITKLEKAFTLDLSQFDFVKEIMKSSDVKLEIVNHKDGGFKRLVTPTTFSEQSEGSLALQDQYSSAGTGQTFNQDHPQRATGYIKIPGYERCNFTKIITGNSMNDALHNGDRIIGELLTNKEAIEWGEIYNIVTPDHDITKRLNEDEENQKYIWCCSDNKEAGAKGKLRYQPIHVLKKDIILIAYVRAAFKPIG
ncbi:MAG: LexA family transcriptional regulator [bacterium]|nr:LexA family transcriptional regulator [bacterium]